MNLQELTRDIYIYHQEPLGPFFFRFWSLAWLNLL